MIRIFSGLSTRFDCTDALESHINVGPNIIAKFLASIYLKNKTNRKRTQIFYEKISNFINMTVGSNSSKMFT